MFSRYHIIKMTLFNENISKLLVAIITNIALIVPGAFCTFMVESTFSFPAL